MTNRDQSQHRSRPVIVLVVFAVLLSAPSGRAGAFCAGDCDGNCAVTVEELIRGVNITLGSAQLSECPAIDLDGDQLATIPELISAVNSALVGCPAASCAARCGDGQVQGDEECDDGGICVGGANAGTACTSESQCVGNGVCIVGSKLGYGCVVDTDCPDGRCVHCNTFGGDGCAANCTRESDVAFPFVPGVVSGLTVNSGTSGLIVHGDVLTVPMQLMGGQTLTIGKAGPDGILPVVIRAASVHVQRINIPTLIDACMYAVPLQTCGGTLFEPDGSESASCTPGFQGQATCVADRPCAFVHGPGNSAGGIVGCGVAGLAGVDLHAMLDGNSSLPSQTSIATSGAGSPGSALLFYSLAVGSPAGVECSTSDPVDFKGAALTTRLTTGTACGEIGNADMQVGARIGPLCVSGQMFGCEPLRGGGIVGVHGELRAATFGDRLLASQFFSQ